MLRRPAIAMVILLGALAAVVILRLALAPSLTGGAQFEWPADGLEWRLRTQRISAAAIVGAALAASGVLLQALLRNPLAAPGILGLTSGAGLAVSIHIYLAYLATGAIVQYSPPIYAALLGSLAALAVVYALGQRRGLIDPLSLILTGVVVGMIASAATVFILQLMPDRGWAAGFRWLLGSLSDDLTWRRLIFPAGVTIGGVALAFRLGPAMDAASFSEDEARAIGVPIAPLRLTLFVTAGVMTAATVLIAGPIGFIGLVAPHAVRLLMGPAHRPLVLASAIAGATLLVGADALVRAVDLASGRMPLGVLTALVGGPVFLWLLRARNLSA